MGEPFPFPALRERIAQLAADGREEEREAAAWDDLGDVPATHRAASDASADQATSLMQRCATCRYWREPAEVYDEYVARIVPRGGKICAARTPRFAVVALHPEEGPVLITAPDFGCVEYERKQE